MILATGYGSGGKKDAQWSKFLWKCEDFNYDIQYILSTISNIQKRIDKYLIS
jgi:hypothetical protein